MSSPPIRVLLVDDEAAIRRALRTPLNELGFETVEVSRGEEALLLVRAESFHVVLLDIQMPGIGGMKTLTRLRALAPRMPILMLTVQDCEEQKVEALECGADDYITKPFSIRECIARIRSAVRRAQTPERTEDATVQIGEIKIQPTRRLVSKSGRPIHLTKKEYDILHYLMLHAGRAVTYGRLLSSVWGMEYRSEVDYLRTFVRQLRKKIEDDPSNPKYLLTDPYVGYRFAEYPLPGDAANPLTTTMDPSSEYNQ
ncbi:MAG TPA: response regulator transcription factor [Acidobacteriaceae bacterium]|nr:response regulator transcription factor [Acidobacteriaceae bacterium]